MEECRQCDEFEDEINNLKDKVEELTKALDEINDIARKLI